MQEIKAYAASRPHGPLEPFTFDPGPLRPDEVDIKVTHCGLCHSDLSMLDNEWGLSRYPFVPGQEAVGTVVAIGEEGAKQAFPNLIYYNKLDKGGHFAAWEQPAVFSAEVRAAFRSVRSNKDAALNK